MGFIETGKWRTDRPNRARYFACGADAVGSAHNVDHEYAYRKAGWRKIARPEAVRLSKSARCTIGGPDRNVRAADFRAVAGHRNRKWSEVKIIPPIPRVDS